ncbi:alpha-L-rhamnosidase C-terminal domain-containing protein [Alistipes indistinctus]|uniref:alpha-L-rhamnosidase-related protein n=1 Tax=Alistipes indistinctus TaxID=626932 RepID=UPI0032BF4698
MINRSRLAALTAVLLLGASTSSPVSATGTRTTDLPGTAGSADVGNSRRPENRPAAGVDPLYSRTAPAPAPDTLPGSPWLYADTELEAWRLHLMRQRVKEARLRVRYPGNYYEPSNRAYFRIPASVDAHYPRWVSLNAYGNVRVMMDGQTIYTGAASTSPHKFKLSAPGTLMVALTTEQEPPALWVEKGEFATGNPLWQASADSLSWSYPCAYPRHKDGTLPHRFEPPTVRLQPASQNDTLYDFGRELFGFIVLKADSKPQFFAGESILEAVDTAARPREQSFDLEAAGKGLWRSVTPVAFRYAYLPDGASVQTVACDAYAHPARYRGDFHSADTLLNDIWFKSAYTLRLCMHEFLMDGIKRDRLPWAGDLAMSMMVNAYTFADREIVRRTIAMLGREGIAQTDINDIADYSLWWLIAQDRYQLFFGDRLHLQREWPRIKKALNVLESRCNQNGILTDSIRWLFIDWVDVEKENALQVLWWWAQQSAVSLAERMGDKPLAAYWQKKSDALKSVLLARGYDPVRQAWRGKPDGESKPNRHANFLAVISGLATPSQYPGILNILGDTTVTTVGTPYMAGFEYMALSRMRAPERMLKQMKKYWGGMIAQGATSFWEGYDANEDEVKQYGFYGRPFGKSLCHAWSSGPAALIPSELLGIRPLSDGWATFEIDPQVPASMQPLEATIPTPYGDIRVWLRDNQLKVEVPQGSTAKFRGKSYTSAVPLEVRL